jgi:phosphatidylserine synthase
MLQDSQHEITILTFAYLGFIVTMVLAIAYSLQYRHQTNRFFIGLPTPANALFYFEFAIDNCNLIR